MGFSGQLHMSQPCVRQYCEYLKYCHGLWNKMQHMSSWAPVKLNTTCESYWLLMRVKSKQTCSRAVPNRDTMIHKFQKLPWLFYHVTSLDYHLNSCKRCLVYCAYMSYTPNVAPEDTSIQALYVHASCNTNTWWWGNMCNQMHLMIACWRLMTCKLIRCSQFNKVLAYNHCYATHVSMTLR